MKYLILAISLLLALPAHAEYRKGEALNHMLSVCLEKADAIGIVEAHAKQGLAVADALWNANPKCNNVPVSGPIVGETVHTATVERDGVKKIARVIEIIGMNGIVLGYFLTTAPLKTERDS